MNSRRLLSDDLDEESISDALRALISKPTKPAYSTVVLSGLVTASEWLTLILTGYILYLVHIAEKLGSQPLYFVIIGAVATSAVAAFHVLGVYRPQAL